MASDGAAVSPQDAYAQAIGNGQATVSLASNLLQFGQPLAEAFLRDRADRKVNADTKRRLQRYMGEWYDYLMVDDKLTWRPVLKSTAFEAHLFDNNVILQPQGACIATTDWAVFLYALAIKPTTKAVYIERGKRIEEVVVSYKPFELEVSHSSDVRGFLEVPGECLCHIMNLYRTSEADVYQTSFGRVVRLTSNGGRTYNVRYEQTDRASLAKVRMPRGMGRSSSDRLTFMPNYLTTIFGRHGVSEGALGLPDPSKPLSERILALKDAIIKIEAWDGHAKRQIMFSPDWFLQASRVFKRATTQGGADSSLLEDVFATHDRILAETTLGLAQQAVRVETFNYQAVKKELRKGFMFGQESYTFRQAESIIVGLPTLPRSYDREHEDSITYMTSSESDRVLEETFTGYKQAKDPWRSELFEARDALKWLMIHGKTIELPANSSILFDEATMPGSALWNATLLLQ
jgi:hypothetical protein